MNKEKLKAILKHGIWDVYGDSVSYKVLALLFGGFTVLFAISGIWWGTSMALCSETWTQPMTQKIWDATTWVAVFSGFGVITVDLVVFSGLVTLILYCFNLQARIKKLEEKLNSVYQK